ncbi:MAG: hypothetical protein IT378_07650 [Sandaracinaceae bacterium]|nr:hypothetical protein [Sandaracinaceae bacterium]
MSGPHTKSSILLTVLTLASCAPSTEASRQSLTAAITAEGTCTPPVLDVDRSLVVHDAATLASADFSLRRTVQAILDTSGGSATTPEAFLDAMLETMRATSRPQPLSGLGLPVDARDEADLDPAALLDPTAFGGMVPVGLFNRFDLAPADGSNCGEHRIVYAMANGPGRLFFIFEAALPNPTPNAGIEGCRPVAELWGSLSDSTLFPTPASRAAALAAFYYQGLPGFAPVVHHANYGSPVGQIRANLFVERVWQLREWRASFDVGQRAIPVARPVGESPLAQLFDSAFDPSKDPEFAGITDPALFAVEQASFQQEFVNAQIALLAAPELSGQPLTAQSIVNGVASQFGDRFEEFQSISQGTEDAPNTHASAAFRSDVTAHLGATGLTELEVLHRAGAMTCGGCHELSSGRAIGRDGNGTTVTWPGTLGFVHIDEGGDLSPALLSFFLPARLGILSAFLCVEPPPVDAGVDAGLDGGTDAGPPMCELRPRRGCCFGDSQCGRGSECIGEVCERGGEGVCEPVFAADDGQCWEDAHCGRGEACVGESICGCGLACLVADHPGRCVGCTAQDASGDGLCRRTLGWRWSGRACEPVTGCLCVGRDCRSLYADEAACLAEREHCKRSIDLARSTFLTSPLASRESSLAELEAAIATERAQEAAEPGAFVPVRRTH